MAKRVNSQASIESIGFGSPVCAPPNIDVTNLPKPAEFFTTKLDPEGPVPPGEYLYNCIALLIYCEKHRKVAICYHERSEAAWLPFAATPVNKSWVDATQDIVNGIFSKEESEGMDISPLSPQIEIKSMHTVHILRIQLPATQKFICRLTQLIKLAAINEKDCVCLQSTIRLKWIGLAEAKSGNVSNLWGPEVAFFAQSVHELKQQEVYEFTLQHAFMHIAPNRDQNVSPEMRFVASIGQEKLEKVYEDFLEFCFPAFYMTFTAFRKYFAEYMSEIMQNEATILQLFNGFNSACNGYLSFHEFFFGLVFMEPACPPNENRLKFIFRYYDVDQDQELNEKEVTKLAIDLLLENLDVFRQQMNSNNLKYCDFIDLVEQGHLPNIWLLCLSQSSIISKICENVVGRQEKRLAASKQIDANLQQANSSRNLCLACQANKKFTFGTHCVRLDPSGRCVEPRRLPDYKTQGDAEKSQEISIAKYSQDYVFSTVSIGHTFLDMVHEFNASKGTSSKLNGFLASHKYRQTFLQYLKVLCQNVSSLFECEDRLLKINSPAYVIGDICGNLDDLLMMGQIIWREVPVVANNYVFLGNYVNVGRWGIECVLVVFALKIIAPNKFFFIRGTNEVREAQNDRNGLRRECLDKYGPECGKEVWNAVNDVFDRMCLAAIIDESVLCLNNSVPHSSASVESIFNVSANLKDLNNDSVAKEMYGKSATNEISVEFLKRNALSHLIRSNLSLPEGYHISSEGKIISTSNRQRSKDELTVICVDRPKIRVVKLDTSK